MTEKLSINLLSTSLLTSVNNEKIYSQFINHEFFHYLYLFNKILLFNKLFKYMTLFILIYG